MFMSMFSFIEHHEHWHGNRVLDAHSDMDNEVEPGLGMCWGDLTMCVVPRVQCTWTRGR